MHAIGTDTTDPFLNSASLSETEDLEGGVHGPPEPSPRRKNSIRTEQENRLFTPRNSHNAGPSSSSHNANTQTDSAAHSDPGTNTSTFSLTENVPVSYPQPLATPLNHINTAINAKTLSQSLDNRSPAPLRNSASKRRLRQGTPGQSQASSAMSLFSPDGSENGSGAGTSSRANRNSWHGSTEAVNGSAIGNGQDADRLSIDSWAFEAHGNHLKMLVEGYERSSVSDLIKREIDLAVHAANGSNEGRNLENGRQSRRVRSMSSFASLREPNGAAWNILIGSTGEHRPTPWTQFKILSGRTFKNLYRNPNLLKTHYVISVVVAGICGGLFWKVKNDIGGFQNRMGLFFFICSLFGFGCLSSMQVCLKLYSWRVYSIDELTFVKFSLI
jgi:hypothetical protein